MVCILIDLLEIIQHNMIWVHACDIRVIPFPENALYLKKNLMGSENTLNQLTHKHKLNDLRNDLFSEVKHSFLF